MLAINKTNEIIKIGDKHVSKMLGGFGEDQPCILIDDISRIHGNNLKYLNELARENIDMFTSDDIIDIFKEDEDLAKNILGKKSRRTELFLFSESGYIKLVSLMRNSDKKKEVMNDFINNYFVMKTQLNNIAKIDPDIFIKTLPTMHPTTIKKYLGSILTPNNVQDIVPAIIDKLKSIDSYTSNECGHHGLQASKKTAMLSAVSNVIKHKMEDNRDSYMGFDREKMLYYDAKIKDYKDILKTTSLASITKFKDDYKRELDKTKGLLEKALEEKAIIEKPAINENNIYEDLLRSFKVYRNFLAKVWGEGMEEVCNDYYDRIPVKLPTAKECIKQGYQSKFEYCYAYYPEDTKAMVHMMYKDCCYNGYLEREK